MPLRRQACKVQSRSSRSSLLPPQRSLWRRLHPLRRCSGHRRRCGGDCWRLPPPPTARQVATPRAPTQEQHSYNHRSPTRILLPVRRLLMAVQVAADSEEAARGAAALTRWSGSPGAAPTLAIPAATTSVLATCTATAPALLPAIAAVQVVGTEPSSRGEVAWWEGAVGKRAPESLHRLTRSGQVKSGCQERDSRHWRGGERAETAGLESAVARGGAQRFSRRDLIGDHICSDRDGKALDSHQSGAELDRSATRRSGASRPALLCTSAGSPDHRSSRSAPRRAARGSAQNSSNVLKTAHLSCFQEM